MSDQNVTQEVAETGSPTTNQTSGADATRQDVDKMFTAEEVNEIVKNRLLKEHKKFAKQQDAQKRPSGVEDDLRSKVSQYEERLGQYEAKLEGFKSSQLKTLVEKKLVEQGCNDPELLTSYLITKGVVRFDDDDSLVVDNASNNLDDLIKSELGKRSHLVKPSQTNGVGSRAPGAIQTSPVDIKNMTKEQWDAWKAAQGLGPKGLF